MHIHSGTSLPAACLSGARGFLAVGRSERDVMGCDGLGSTGLGDGSWESIHINRAAEFHLLLFTYFIPIYLLVAAVFTKARARRTRNDTSFFFSFFLFFPLNFFFCPYPPLSPHCCRCSCSQEGGRLPHQPSYAPSDANAAYAELRECPCPGGYELSSDTTVNTLSPAWWDTTHLEKKERVCSSSEIRGDTNHFEHSAGRPGWLACLPPR